MNLQNHCLKLLGLRLHLNKPSLTFVTNKGQGGSSSVSSTYFPTYIC